MKQYHLIRMLDQIIYYGQRVAEITKIRNSEVVVVVEESRAVYFVFFFTLTARTNSCCRCENIHNTCMLNV